MLRQIISFVVAYVATFATRKHGPRKLAFWLATAIILIFCAVAALEFADYWSSAKGVDYAPSALLGAEIALVATMAGIGAYALFQKAKKVIGLVAPE